ncbi:hypothetical protein BWZ20_09650 [Winogradskyella sp. J14-2]|uniref:DUF4421 family protein n=1 Tax=Winogradskyella sp. J14-2 TaxID=1936080 RepID=UPI0009727BA8|nr:DUF4421 family protein [Winogradskyella sp. J14-2]APY08549.1 hypothetical protein BWZ20_09650 [Winogradskyella sp. J14-2]
MGLIIKTILLFLFCEIVNSQQDSLSENQYITTFPNKISARISLVNTSNSFILNDVANNATYKLKPNVREYLGFSVLFRSIEIDYGFSPQIFNANKDNDNSKLYNLNLRMFLGQWMQTIDLYSQKGFNFSSNNQRVNLNGVKTFKIGGSTSYILNKDFSFRAIGFQNEWQTKSAGSFIPSIYYYYTKYNLSLESIEEVAHSYDIALGPSYYYNFCLTKNFIVSLGAHAGVGLNHSSNLGEGDFTSILYDFSGRVVVGYNSDTFFAGINSNIILLEHKIDASTVQDDTITFLEFYIGYRFNAPKKWVKFADDFNKKYGL